MAPPPSLHARITFWTTLVAVAIVLWAPLIFFFITGANMTDPLFDSIGATPFDDIERSMLEGEEYTPEPVSVWNIALVGVAFSLLYYWHWILGAFAAWLAYRLVLRSAAPRLRRASLICLNTLAISFVLSALLFLALPDHTRAVAFRFDADSLTQPYQNVFNALRALDWLSGISVLAFLVLCLLAIVQRLRKAWT